jgi:hypothetical protein
MFGLRLAAIWRVAAQTALAGLDKFFAEIAQQWFGAL